MFFNFFCIADEIVSDCWNDVDETEFACKEKARIMLLLKPPGYQNAIDTDRLIPKNRRGTSPNQCDPSVNCTLAIWREKDPNLKNVNTPVLIGVTIEKRSCFDWRYVTRSSNFFRLGL